jgi:4-hydroxythreonine-4-phosphate dehydrogenase
MSTRLIAVTMGDPAGIGPEIIVRSWNSSALASLRRVVVGSPGVLRRASKLVSSRLSVRVLSEPNERFDPQNEIGVVPIAISDADLLAQARIDRACGEAAYQALELAARLAIERRVDAIVTAPINKQALHLAGHEFPGHTELLAKWCGVDKFAMMLYLPPGETVAGEIGLGVIHTTLHMALRDVFQHLSQESILATSGLAVDFVRSLLKAQGLARAERVAVAALNPHAGEGGLFGDEEQRIIAPAVAAGKSRGWHLTGPLPTDTLMHRAVAGEFDAVVAMYHDQGHIALKLLELRRAVNVTLGLPIVRTSVAHGTAFDIAWQDRADASSLIVACQLADALAQNAINQAASSRQV